MRGLAWVVVKYPFATYGIGHKAVRHRWQGIFNMMSDEVERVEHVARTCFMQFKMQVRCLRCARISANGNELSLCNR